MANIALVLTDNVLYKNEFVNKLVQTCRSSIVLIIELKFKHPDTNTFTHLMRYIQLLGIKGTVYTGWLVLKNRVNKITAKFSSVKKGYSLKQIAEKNKIQYFLVNDINSDDSIELFKKNKTDYIINSGNQIYKGKILKEFEGHILNRHSALLPAYGGIYPIFWQLLHGKTEGGVTLHWIDRYIDRGTIAYQKAFNIEREKSLFYHYKVAFDISLELCIRAIEDLNEGKLISYQMNGNASYYSWPAREDIRRFHHMKLKIV